MALLATQSLTMNGAAATYSAVSASDTFANTGEEVLHIKNGSAAEVTVTVTSAQQCNQGFTHNLTVTLDAGVDKFVGPFPTNRFNNSSGVCTFACSPITDVTAAILRVRG